MVLFIAAIGLVFTLYLGFQGGFAASREDGVVVKVGDRRYDIRDVQRVRANLESQLARNLGDGFDAEAAAAFLDEQAAGTVLRGALMTREAKRMGLVASMGEVREFMRGIFGNEEGALDPELVTNYAERQFGSLRAFQDVLREQILELKAQRLMWDSIDVSEAEAREALRYAQEEVEIAFVSFDGAKVPEGLEPDEAAVQALLTDPGPALQEAYDKRASEFDRPEQVKARHILIRKGDSEESAAAARKKLIDARARIEAGESFEDVAKDASEDGSSERGGDLGFFARGAMVKEFEDAAFALEPGVLSEIVETSFGFHLIQVDEKKPAQLVPFEQAREQIARDLALAEASLEAAKARAEAVAERVRGGESLIGAARAEELSVERPDAMRRRPDGFVPRLGAAPEVQRAAFALTAEAPSDPTVFEVLDRKFVLIQLLDRKSPTDEELAERVPAERDRLVRERRQGLQTAWLEGARDELETTGQLVYDLSAFNN